MILKKLISTKQSIPKELIPFLKVANFPVLHVNSEEKSSLMGSKVFTVLNETYDLYKNNFDWFFMIDDDGYVFVDNLLKFISSKNASDSKMYGFRFIHEMPKAPDGHIGGGSGKVDFEYVS
jgi:hypothetical protein